MQFHFHTKVVLFNPQNKILVLQRADTWKRDFPWGKTEVPEHIENAIIREVQEEISINTIQDLQIFYLESDYKTEQDLYFVCMFYKGKIDQTDIRISNEHTAYQRIDKKDLFSIGLSDYLQQNLATTQHLF